MSILEIKSIEKIEDDYYHVIALIEDSVMVFPGDRIDPPEYGPAYCEGTFTLGEDEILPKEESNLIEYLNDAYIDWVLCDSDQF